MIDPPRDTEFNWSAQSTVRSLACGSANLNSPDRSQPLIKEVALISELGVFHKALGLNDKRFGNGSIARFCGHSSKKLAIAAFSPSKYWPPGRWSVTAL